MSLNNWMASVTQSQSLSALSIPGTHESCALYDHATAGYTQCQWLSIPDQLLNGIRFLDIRPTYEVDGKKFEITHGGYDQNITLAEVQTQVIDFLMANPSEVVLMNIQQEYSTASNQDFVDRFDSVVQGYENYWFFDERIPTVEEARGRIVLIRAYDPNAFDPSNPTNGGWLTNKGIPFNGFNINGISSNNYFQTQNYWNAWESDKKTAIKAWLPAPMSGQIVLNFLSYAHGGATPGRNAEAMNPDIFAYIQGIDPSRCLGVLPMDFATNTPGFIEEIIRHNS
ncbi:MAG TPA: phosphatidylinositol-specific phospholipase C domain-containing protein [Chthonomonadaceae bacterium]|nr:phosphatidylinositol-specific phospholipase C domain-containing protein [Chthonomonadaceae bacterium]